MKDEQLLPKLLSSSHTGPPELILLDKLLAVITLCAGMLLCAEVMFNCELILGSKRQTTVKVIRSVSTLYTALCRHSFTKSDSFNIYLFKIYEIQGVTFVQLKMLLKVKACVY